jgi:hypothetical protein
MSKIDRRPRNSAMTELIIPPQSIIKIINATVPLIVRWGGALEKRILEEKKDPKFSFLLPDDPFHAYYQMKLEEAVSGTKQNQAIPAPIAAAPPPPVARPIPKIIPPSFTYQQPPHIGGLQLDVIHLTAQNAALYGKEFLAAIAKQESESPLFNFLKPGEPYFRFFYALYDQYKLALDPSGQLRRRLEQEAASLVNVKANLDMEAEHERMTMEQKRKEAEDAKSADDIYDWDDFKVLGTVDYDEEPPKRPEEPIGPRVPRSIRRRTSIQQISPVTGQKVAVEDFGDHLRFELQHPQYQKELTTRKERFQQQHSALATGEEIAANLRQFARGEPQKVAHPAVWDGRQETIQKVVTQSMLALDEAQAEKPEPKKAAPIIGPVFGKKKDPQ